MKYLPLFVASSILSVLAQTAIPESLASLLMQIPFVAAIIWLFLRLVDKQESMLEDLHERNTEIIKLITSRFEEIDQRRSADSVALTSTLLAIIADDKMDKSQAGALADGLRQRERKASQRTQDIILRKLES